MINVVIIDDEQNNLDNLVNLLERHCSNVSVSATALNAEEGKCIILKQQPELIFLDIQMPGKNGFDLLQSLPNHPFEIIFVTAFDQYGIQAVKFAAIDYLLKPVDIDELKAAVSKAILKSQQKKQNLQLENLLQFLHDTRQQEDPRIALPTAKETRFVKTQEIIRCESSNNYTAFFLLSGEKLIISKPIYEYEDLLKDYGFLRCHQSHLINRKYIKSLVKEDGGYLLLDDLSQIPISKQKKEFIRLAITKIK